MSRNRINEYMSNIQRDCKILVIFSFGEFDIRCGIPKNMCPNSPIEAILNSI